MIDVLLAGATADPATALILADSSSSSTGFAFFLAGPATFIAVYLGIYGYYRNTKKRHEFERETEVAVGNLRTGDRRVGSNNRQTNRTMRGSNHTNHLQRVRRIAVE